MSAGGADGGTNDAAAEAGPSSYDAPYEPPASECTYLDFKARNDATGTPFTVPTGEDYHDFGFHLNVSAGAQAVAFYPKIDNASVVVEWLLYRTTTVQSSGQTWTALPTHPDGQVIAGWAPGAGPWFLPSHVGIDMGGGDFILEVHYKNSGAPVSDSSGVQVCQSLTSRPDLAGISWLGTESFTIPAGAVMYDVASNCHPKNQPIHILTAWPRMRQLGVHSSAKIHHLDGSVSNFVNVDFALASQSWYSVPTLLGAGEWIESHCYYTNPGPTSVGFGVAASNEECFDFVAAYPPAALIGGYSVATSTPCNN